jgi:hypothetical protein
VHDETLRSIGRCQFQGTAARASPSVAIVRPSFRAIGLSSLRAQVIGFARLRLTVAKQTGRRSSAHARAACADASGRGERRRAIVAERPR